MEEFLAASGGGGAAAGGAADPVTAIANLGTEMYRFFQSGIDLITWRKKRQYELIPEYADPADYLPEPDYTIPIIIGSMALVFIAMAFAIRK